METRTLVLLSAVPVLLAACASPLREEPTPTQPPPEAQAPAAPVAAAVPAVPAYRPGPATIESASVVSLSSSPSAGGSSAPSATMAYRLRMGDGSTQNVVQTGERFAVGDHVQMTVDGRLVRP